MSLLSLRKQGGARGFSGDPGAPGSIFRSGAGVPSDALGIDGDWYLNETTKNLYERVAGHYVLKVNMTAALAQVLAEGNDAGGARVVNLGDPTGAQDAATKHYIDAALAPSVEGTPGGQSLASSDFQVVATTTNAAPVTVDTGYAPPNGHAAHVDGSYGITDRTAHTNRSKGISVAIRKYGGTLVVSGSVPPGGVAVGDSMTGGGSPAQPEISFGVSVGGTLTITFTPAASYVGTLDWLANITVVEN